MIHWIPADLETFGSCGSTAAPDLQLIEALDREVLLGAQIQQTLLGGFSDLELNGVSLYGSSLPSRQVGGDFYDAFSTYPHSLDIILGDVMGKGISAALVGAAIRTQMYRTLFEQFRDRTTQTPGVTEILAALDDRLREDLRSLHQFATMVYARVDIQTMLLEYSDCGHTPFCWYEQATGQVWTAKGANMPLGFSDRQQQYESFMLPVSPQDILLFYSDGLSDAVDEYKKPFGTYELTRVLQQNSGKSVKDISHALLQSAVLYSSGDLLDDITTAVVRINQPDLWQLPHTIERKSASWTLACRDQLPALRTWLLQQFSEWLPSEAGSKRTSLLDAMTIAAIEAATNILDHAQLEPAAEILVSALYIEANSVWVMYEYQGVTFEWTELPTAMLDELTQQYSSSGFGRPLIQNLIDQHSILVGSDRNIRLLLRKDAAL